MNGDGQIPSSGLMTYKKEMSLSRRRLQAEIEEEKGNKCKLGEFRMLEEQGNKCKLGEFQVFLL